jgi:hypothetical protein
MATHRHADADAIADAAKGPILEHAGACHQLRLALLTIEGTEVSEYH